MSEIARLLDLKQKVLPARILAVSKLQPIEKIKYLFNQGQKDFGENYVQEALAKQDEFKDQTDLRWHLIGHLQKNKVKQVVGRFALIHSVDSLALAELISKKSSEQKLIQKILIEVNLAGENTKTGFQLTDLQRDWKALCDLESIEIEGLMTMPPLTENNEEVRPYFRKLKSLQKELKPITPARHSLAELSMGTSGDFEVAVQEGATIVRLGTILFGERTPKR